MKLLGLFLISVFMIIPAGIIDVYGYYPKIVAIIILPGLVLLSFSIGRFLRKFVEIMEALKKSEGGE